MVSESRVPGSAAITRGGRYRLHSVLGTGGVAVVHRARDLVTGHDVALKHLRTDGAGGGERAVDLFRQEFYTLSQLAHPNVVAAYDYAVDELGPFYTMELLDGGDLLERVPLDWRSACRIARDLCSALSLVHGRRLVYRDLSPRNVRCTASGRAKLLDFGALSPMGPAKTFVGTLAVSAPEAVHLQPLDGRADLYSLGATLYYALTGRRAYSAANLAQLVAAWHHRLTPPSDLVAGIPLALDALVLELLELDPSRRPVSAAETVERLSAIAGIERDDASSLVSKAYLTTPTLVGRDAALARFRKQLLAARQGKGGAVLFHGPRGVGRTRLLDACVLEGKLAGFTVVRADRTDSASGDRGGARSIASQLFDAAPELARECAGRGATVLSSLVPALAPSGSTTPPETPTSTGDLSRALREWICALSRRTPVLVVIDDVHRVDAQTASLAALLSLEAKGHRVLVATSLPDLEEKRRSETLRLLAVESRVVRLGPLSAARTERLLRSLFGDVPNVQLGARWLHAVSKGIPRDLLQLAQHLVDQQLFTYAGGTWTLPATLDAGSLPGDMAVARRVHIDALTEDARVLGGALALGPDRPFTFEECLKVSGHADAPRLISTLSHLVEAGMLERAAGGHALGDAGWREPLSLSFAGEQARELHLRLADIFEVEAADGFQRAAHLLAAGDEQEALDALVTWTEHSLAQTDTSIEAFAKLLQSLPEGWRDLYDRGLELCEKYGRTKREALLLRTRVAGIASQLPFEATKYFEPILTQLVHDAGLDLYATLPADLPPGERLQRSLALARERHALSGDAECVLGPATAIGALGRMVATGIGSVSASVSIPLLTLLPSLEPLAPLSPALTSWQRLVDGVRARVLARGEEARAIYLRQLERLAGPDRGGLDETYQVTQQLGICQGVGILEASMGLGVSLERADFLATSALHEVNALRLRALYHLWQGDLPESDRWKERAELLAIERARRQTNEGAHLLRELLGHSLTDDLTRVKRTLNAISPLAARTLGWRAVLHWGQAEYQRIRGNIEGALREAEQALASMDPGGHPVWPEAAGCHVRLLVASGRPEEAERRGREYLAEAARRRIGYEQSYVRLPLALALAELHRHEEAIKECEEATERFLSLGSTGLNLGVAYETRARVALLAGDADTFRKFADLAGTHFKSELGGPLAARHDRLLREAERAGLLGDEALPSRIENAMPLTDTTEIRAALEACSSEPERLGRALQLLLQTSGARSGFLFESRSGELSLAAREGDAELSDQLTRTVAEHLRAQEGADLASTLVTDELTAAATPQWRTEDGGVYHPVVLSHLEGDTHVVTGVALLLVPAGQAFRYPSGVAARISQIQGAGSTPRRLRA